MKTQNPQNIIIFSAGESERNGNFGTVKSFIEGAGHRCHGWRELFHGAKNSSQIALLPMLLKKVPTFDFAIILGDAVDALKEFREEVFTDENKLMRIMRDNVLFETGLCTMALGADRVILLIEDDIRIPEDLDGVREGTEISVTKRVGVGKLGVRNYVYANPLPNGQMPPPLTEVEGQIKEVRSLTDHLEDVVAYIDSQSQHIHPIVIGAAISTADGYFNNFILRFWEHIANGYKDEGAPTDSPPVPFPEGRVSMRILVPRKLDDQIGRRIWNYYQAEGYRKGTIANAGSRGVEFRYKVDADGSMIICDIPTTVTASYNVVEDILQLDADDKDDLLAKDRFLLKELDSFHRTLRKVMVRDKVAKKLKSFKKKDDETVRILHGMDKVQVEQVTI